MTDNLTNSGLSGSTGNTGFGGGSTSGGFGGEAAGGFSSQGSASGQGIKQQAQEKAQALQGQAMQLKDQALDKARTAAEGQKSKAADTIEEIAQSARQAVGQLSQNPTIAPIARYGDQAADALERFATSLRSKDVDQLVNEIGGLVRRNPAIAAGIAVAAGFALTRLLRGGMTAGQGGFGGQRFANDEFGSSSTGGFSGGSDTSGFGGSTTGGFTGGSTAGAGGGFQSSGAL